MRSVLTIWHISKKDWENYKSTQIISVLLPTSTLRLIENNLDKNKWIKWIVVQCHCQERTQKWREHIVCWYLIFFIVRRCSRGAWPIKTLTCLNHSEQHDIEIIPRKGNNTTTPTIFKHMYCIHMHGLWRWGNLQYNTDFDEVPTYTNVCFSWSVVWEEITRYCLISPCRWITKLTKGRGTDFPIHQNFGFIKVY